MKIRSIIHSLAAALLASGLSACAVIEKGASVVKTGAYVLGTTVAVASTVGVVAATTAGVAKTVAVTTAGVAVATTSTAVAVGSLVVSASTSAANVRRGDDIATESVVAFAPERFSAPDGRVWITRNCGGIANGQPALWVARRSGENEIRVNEATICLVVAPQ